VSTPSRWRRPTTSAATRIRSDRAVRELEAQARTQAAFIRGLQTHDGELDFNRVIG
jgi:hypothetical protein